MRVFHINCNYLTTALHQTMVEKLSELGIKSNVFAPTYNINLAVIKPNNNVFVEECFRKWDRVSYFHKQRHIIKSAEKRFQEEERDLLHAYTLFTDGNVARTLSRKYGVPYVVAIRDTDVNDFFKYRPYLIKLGIKIMVEASAVFFLSEAYKKIVLEKYVPIDLRKKIEAKSYIIPNGINDYWLENKWNNRETIPNLSKKELKVIYAGRINKRKNITTTQKALNLLRSRGWIINYTIVGKVEDQKEFEEIKRLGNVNYIPAQPKEILSELYRSNEVFVMPSHTETFGLVYAEAMTQGLPVVYTKGQGFDGQFPEGSVGYRVNDNSPEDIAAAIEKVVGNYSKLSFQCTDLCDKFKWLGICKMYVEIYTGIING